LEAVFRGFTVKKVNSLIVLEVFMRIHNFRSILKGTLMAKFDLELVSGMIVPCAVLRRSDNGVPFVAADSRTDWTGDQVIGSSIKT